MIAGLDDAATFLAHDPDLPGSPVVPPIYQTSLFTFANYAEMRACFAGAIARPIYSRGDNPTVMELERRIAALEATEAARAFSSGMGAIAAAVLAFVQSGGRIVVVRHCYGDAYRLFERLLPRLGIRVDYVDGSDTDAVARALPGAAVLYLESPTSMVFELQDLATLGALARQHGVVTIADNSWATPLFQQPCRHGIDLVLHSASKYLSGHSDTVAGVVAGPAALIARINTETYPFLGAKLAPIEAFLVLRGLRTLPLRMERHQATGLRLAQWLASHELVTRVHHPALSNHPGQATLRGFSSLLSFEVAAGVDVPRLVDGLRLFRLGVSWGGHESLVVPAMAALDQTPGVNALARFGVSDRLIRIHAGLESPDALQADLDRAIRAAASG